MKKLTLTLVLALTFIGAIFSQREETIFNNHKIRLTGAWGSSSLGLTKVQGQSAMITGSYVGLEFNKAVLIGWDWHNFENIVLPNSNGQKLNFAFTGPMINYSPSMDKAIHPVFGVGVARGWLGYSNDFIGSNDAVLVVRPNIGAEINIFRWLHLGVEGGYSFTSGSNIIGLSDKELSQPYGQLTFKFGYSWGKKKQISTKGV